MAVYTPSRASDSLLFFANDFEIEFDKKFWSMRIFKRLGTSNRLLKMLLFVILSYSFKDHLYVPLS